eukprot:CAMPEP_0184539478 /NCGR_PEP_ID=MMETSP0198_2-20121128/18154_1 /TAXON_ID=1112570 /ORGANISM="Thraustochytrium sp., Strain LLF1b" /LENGTH=107 /DNA_ID=CAMNT_0026933009 /DNA_START=365 /DNA_END=688 /DNA_ORIENTATION=-
MAPPQMPAPGLTNPTEFTVDITWTPVQGATKFKLYRRKVPEEWNSANFTELDANSTSFTLEDLEPTSTYQFRIAAVGADGEGPSSEEVTIDTAVGNCAPKKKKCVIQ